jgi:hypothetical protein
MVADMQMSDVLPDLSLITVLASFVALLNLPEKPAGSVRMLFEHILDAADGSDFSFPVVKDNTQFFKPPTVGDEDDDLFFGLTV